ncbi:hypothetical protein A0H81_02996 [Grifola frondosa]|uniref:Uncharacterized protein n=1 Tax=Grifola frondosa TaxID=5627 RepID=A0A1C7MI27_GRIFR|nr:hypothetical protein A0H81_02996 [Grifola frondosa]
MSIQLGLTQLKRTIMRYPPPSFEQICGIARKAIDIFRSHGLECCLVGGVGCHLFGTSRDPTSGCSYQSTQQEELKRYLVQADSDFYLISARDPRATYKVLWYRISSTYYERRCKVDILIPGILNIPDVPYAHVKVISRLPVMPLIPLLLLKLQAWADHGNATRFDLRMKQDVDIRDINELLEIALRRRERVSDVVNWLPKEFLDAARIRIRAYTTVPIIRLFLGRALDSQHDRAHFSIDVYQTENEVLASGHPVVRSYVLVQFSRLDPELYCVKLRTYDLFMKYKCCVQ